MHPCVITAPGDKINLPDGGGAPAPPCPHLTPGADSRRWLLRVLDAHGGVFTRIAGWVRTEAGGGQARRIVEAYAAVFEGTPPQEEPTLSPRGRSR
jgi:hypothetical protein